MKDTQALSTFQDWPPATEAQPPLLFDVCQPGMVLRAVLLVELAVGVGSLFFASTLLDWWGRVALATAGAVPSTLAGLLLVCALKKTLARWAPGLQYALTMALGALAGVASCALWRALESAPALAWLASACSGAVLAALLQLLLVLRAKGRTPTDTAARLAELQSRIRPHFLFNTLNSAIALVRAEPARAEALLEDLSDLFRHALLPPGEAVSLASEIALAQRYLAIEQVRFGARLQVQWDLDPRADAARVPPLLLQPLVENAVRHGVEPSLQGAQVWVSTQRRGHVVVLKVSNTVPAGQGVQGHGLALRNVRERLALMHDVLGQFRSGLQGGVYHVRIEVPV